MTTIGSTAYYTSDTRYGGSEKASTKAENTYTTSQQYLKSKSLDAGENPSGLSIVTLELKGKLAAFYLFDLSNAKQMDISALPEDQYKEFMEGEQRRIEANKFFLEHQYTILEQPDFSNYAGMKSYAEVVVGGVVVATVDNQAGVRTDNALGQRIREFMSSWRTGRPGPEDAQIRAEEVAKLVGGHVRKTDTALTQKEFDALPPIPEAKVTVDYEGIKADPLYAQIQGWMENYARIEQNRAEYMGRS